MWTSPNSIGATTFFDVSTFETHEDSKRATTEPIESNYTLKNDMGSNMGGSCYRSSGGLDTPCGSNLTSKRVKRGNIGGRRPRSIKSKEFEVSWKIPEVRCGKKKGKVVEIASDHD